MMKINTMDKCDYYTPEEIAEKYGIPLKRVRRSLYLGRVPGQTKVFGVWRIHKAQFDVKVQNKGF